MQMTDTNPNLRAKAAGIETDKGRYFCGLLVKDQQQRCFDYLPNFNESATFFLRSYGVATTK